MTAKDTLEPLIDFAVELTGMRPSTIVEWKSYKEASQALYQQIMEIVGRGQHVSKEHLSQCDYHAQEAVNKRLKQQRQKLEEYFGQGEV